MVYGSETSSLSAQERRKIGVFTRMCLRNICGIRRVDRVRSLQIREWCGCELSALERIGRNLIKYFGHVERRRKKKFLKKVYRATVKGNWGRGRSQRR